MTTHEEIKAIIIMSGWTMTRVVDEINKKYNRSDTLQIFSNKLKRGGLRYREAQEIAEVLGMTIKWEKDRPPN